MFAEVRRREERVCRCVCRGEEGVEGGRVCMCVCRVGRREWREEGRVGVFAEGVLLCEGWKPCFNQGTICER